jgi:hypothetical protein
MKRKQPVSNARLDAIPRILDPQLAYSAKMAHLPAQRDRLVARIVLQEVLMLKRIKLAALSAQLAHTAQMELAAVTVASLATIQKLVLQPVYHVRQERSQLLRQAHPAKIAMLVAMRVNLQRVVVLPAALAHSQSHQVHYPVQPAQPERTLRRARRPALIAALETTANQRQSVNVRRLQRVPTWPALDKQVTHFVQQVHLAQTYQATAAANAQQENLPHLKGQ